MSIGTLVSRCVAIFWKDKENAARKLVEWELVTWMKIPDNNGTLFQELSGW